jgi:hypothetical protein
MYIAGKAVCSLNISKTRDTCNLSMGVLDSLFVFGNQYFFYKKIIKNELVGWLIDWCLTPTLEIFQLSWREQILLLN